MRKFAGLLAFSCVLVTASFANAGLALRINGSANPTISLGPAGSTQQLTVSVLGTIGAFPDDFAVPTLANFDFLLQIGNTAAAQITAITLGAGAIDGSVNLATGRATGGFNPPTSTSPALNLATFTIRSLTLSSNVTTSISLRDPDLLNAGNFRAANGPSTTTIDRDSSVFTGAGGLSTTSATLNVAAVPEPSSMLLLASAGLAGLRFRRRKATKVS